LGAVKYVVGGRTLRLMLEGGPRVLCDKKLKYGKYRIVKRYVVKGVVLGCSSEGQGVAGE
jgi:hypothetical protein